MAVNIEKLKKVMEAMGEDALTLTQAKKLVEILVDKIKIVSEQLKTDTNKTKEELKSELNKAVSLIREAEKTLTKANKQSQLVVSEVKPMMRQAFREIDDLRKNMPEMPEIPDVSEYIKLEDVKDLIPKIPEIPNTLKLTKELEDKLNKKIDDLEKRTAKGFGNINRGGGTSALGVAQSFKWIAHTEAPTGDIDGVNTTYTVKNNIWWIAGFTLNGEQIAELPNFTYVNKTITFSSAIPAAYSGKDFEVKYIGT